MIVPQCGVLVPANKLALLAVPASLGVEIGNKPLIVDFYQLQSMLLVCIGKLNQLVHICSNNNDDCCFEDNISHIHMQNEHFVIR